MKMTDSRLLKQKKYKPHVTAIIQARMQSTRLPGKSMLELAGKPLIYHVIERTMSIEGVDTTVMATAVGEENKPIIELAESMNCEIFVGSQENVLERYYLASEKFGGEFIVRITGDNPFTDVHFAEISVRKAIDSDSDLLSPLNLPLGTAVEVIKKEALDKAYKLSNEPHHFEHVTPIIKEHPEEFRIERYHVDLKNPFKDIRLTVDTHEDYNFSKILYDNLYHGKPFSINAIIKFIDKNPELLKLNSGIKQRPMRHSEKKHVQ
jgi:spore coat polysaccharide biosynthesis protein SpsF